jgi:hypothetical protein
MVRPNKVTGIKTYFLPAALVTDVLLSKGAARRAELYLISRAGPAIRGAAASRKWPHCIGIFSAVNEPCDEIFVASMRSNHWDPDRNSSVKK